MDKYDRVDKDFSRAVWFFVAVIIGLTIGWFSNFFANLSTVKPEITTFEIDGIEYNFGCTVKEVLYNPKITLDEKAPKKVKPGETVSVQIHFKNAERLEYEGVVLDDGLYTFTVILTNNTDTTVPIETLQINRIKINSGVLFATHLDENIKFLTISTTEIFENHPSAAIKDKFGDSVHAKIDGKDVNIWTKDIKGTSNVLKIMTWPDYSNILEFWIESK